MEIISSYGMTVMMDSTYAECGRAWDTVIAPGLWFGTVLEGEVAVSTGSGIDGKWGAGSTTRFNVQDPVPTHHRALSDGVISAVFVRVAPDDIQKLMDDEAMDILEKQPIQISMLTQLARSIAWQMRACALEGPARRLYLSGKAMEMMAEAISHPHSETQARPAGHRIWSARDVECFHGARSILLAELAAPPSLPDLARRVGTNARKLSEGFSDLFGTSVYAFVKAHRLDEARRMIEAGENSITRVARALGYQPAHFSTAFRQRFGVSPSALIRNNTI